MEPLFTTTLDKFMKHGFKGFADLKDFMPEEGVMQLHRTICKYLTSAASEFIEPRFYKDVNLVVLSVLHEPLGTVRPSKLIAGVGKITKVQNYTFVIEVEPATDYVDSGRYTFVCEEWSGSKGYLWLIDVNEPRPIDEDD